MPYLVPYTPSTAARPHPEPGFRADTNLQVTYGRGQPALCFCLVISERCQTAKWLYGIWLVAYKQGGDRGRGR